MPDALTAWHATIAKDLAFGAGSYAVPSAGTASFGFAVALAPHSPSTYLGQLNVITPGKWWFEGNVTSYGKTGSGHGLLAGAACTHGTRRWTEVTAVASS